MTTKKYQLEKYRKYLLNRVTTSNQVTDFIEHCLASDDEAIPHTFHKIMIQNWGRDESELFETITKFYNCMFVPVNCTTQGEITTFYTCSLNLVNKIAKHDFLFPHQRHMFNIDILFNDKTSGDCFDNRITIEDITAGVVSNRLNEKFELNLSRFCEDPEFTQNNINFYKLGLLSHFKILMLRIGKDTKHLNLSHNKLSQVPAEILNFFIRGDLTGVNLSYNNIASISELHRVSSKIERLWVEGNPLCKDMDAFDYVKEISKKFPRLTELDSVKLNEHGIVMPFYQNYLVVPDKKNKMVAEKFMSLYFAHYDSNNRRNLESFYKSGATLSMSCDATAAKLDAIDRRGRNMLNAKGKNRESVNKQLYSGRQLIVGILIGLPPSSHDPTTFTVDVLQHDNKHMILIIDGIFKDNVKSQLYQFRRTFIFDITTKNHISEYLISTEMFTIISTTRQQAGYSFKDPSRVVNPYALKQPEKDEIAALSNIFSHLTQLKIQEAELRLSVHHWDIQKALEEYIQHMNLNQIKSNTLYDSDDFSDISSLGD